jgi:hypothetical protein
VQLLVLLLEVQSVLVLPFLLSVSQCHFAHFQLVSELDSLLETLQVQVVKDVVLLTQSGIEILL